LRTHRLKEDGTEDDSQEKEKHGEERQPRLHKNINVSSNSGNTATDV
jgi:hypothetical protein